MIRKWIYKLRYILIIGSALLGLLGASGTFGYDYDIAYKVNFNWYLYPLSDSRFNGYSYTFYSNGNFTTTYGGDTFDGLYIPVNDQRGTTYNTVSVFRNDNKLYVYSRDNIQGYFLSFCEGSFDNFATDNNDINDCLLNNPYNGANTGNFIDFEQFISPRYLNNIQGVFYISREGGGWSGSPIPFGFLYNDGTFVIFQPDTTLLTGSLGFNFGIPPSSSMSFANFSTMSSYMESAPSSGGGGNGGGLITDTGSMTNFEAILGYNYTYGFNESYCYGGYPISDIFNSTDNPQNFTGFELGTGAYIYDIYNAYSGSYFTSASQFYQSFYSRYLINNIASFYNYPKALYGIVERYAWLYDHYQTYDPNIGISKLVSYCELYKLNPDDLYTGGDISAENGYSNMIGEITDKWRYYDSGPLSLLSGEDQKLDSDKFFTFLSDSVINGFGDLSNKSSGIIPNYIIAVLLALVLFRMFSH